MEYEADAHHRYKDKALSGDGGVEWFKVNAEHVVDELTKKWSRRPSSGSLI
jgi:hypothetical protein